MGQITFTITGVLCTDSRRDLKENRVDWGSDLSEVQMPTIYLWRDDCDLDENTFVYTAVSLYGDDEITEQSESAMEEFAQDYYDKLEYGQDPAAADRLQKISATLPLETRSLTAKVICRTLSREYYISVLLL